MRYVHRMRARTEHNGMADAGKVLDGLLRRMGGSEQARLVHLWRHWDMVMGPELAALAWPLGHRCGTLLVGGEDAMVMQDLSLMADEILERANGFMEEPFFATVKVTLCLGKHPLNALAGVGAPSARPLSESAVPLRGTYLASMPADSPVARCYARFVRRGGHGAP